MELQYPLLCELLELLSMCDVGGGGGGTADTEVTDADTMGRWMGWKRFAPAPSLSCTSM